MATDGQLTGMRGVFLVTAKLARLGLIVSPTSRNAFGADLLATARDCSRTWSVQVKTNSKPASFWPMGKNCQEVKSRSFVYVFVNLRDDEKPRSAVFYVVSSMSVARKVKRYTVASAKGTCEGGGLVREVCLALRSARCRRSCPSRSGPCAPPVG